MATQDRVKVHSSRLWALCHFNFTRLLLPERMVADETGVTKVNLNSWYLPWVGHRQRLPLSHIANVDRDKGIYWDTVMVQSAGGVDPLVVHNTSKQSARRFVNTVNEWIENRR